MRLKSFKTLWLFLMFLSYSCFGQDETKVVIEHNSPIVQGGALTQDVGIEMWGGTLNPIIFMGCDLPCTEDQMFSTADADQIDMTIKLVRGTSKYSKDGTYLGTYKIDGLVPGPEGRTLLNIEFGASQGDLWFSAKDLNGLSRIKITKIVNK
ncbi:Hsp70 family protein [Vibrio sp.]|nr:Hsp70 family protein [Vibrio sp.]